MKTYNIKEMVNGNKKVKFVRYQQKQLWYITECGFEFPVDISDTGDAVFLSEDKAMFFMRWINRHIKDINKARQEQDIAI